MSMDDAFAALKQGKKPAPAEQIDFEGMPKAAPKVRAAKPPAKSKDPDYQKVTVYMRSDLRRKAERKWEDTGETDLSDLLETLMNEYTRIGA